MKRRNAIAVTIVLASCGSPADRTREVARVRAHLEGVEGELRASTPATLTAVQAEQRALAIEHLRQYIDAERYPLNDLSDETTPIFVDGHGARCAVAALLEASGHGALVERIARTHNLAYVRELADDPDLQAWLTANGVTLTEAARIQPEYPNWHRSTWQPTASVVFSVDGGVLPGAGAEAVYAPGIRFGARRVTGPNSACDHCVYYSTALVAEYRRGVSRNAGSTNYLGLLVQHDLSERSDIQYYVSGGPLASVDGDSEPGTGLGAQVGLGLSFRHPVGLLGELTASALGNSRGATVLGGFSLGVVW
jgi:hypothetical protein